MAVHYASKFHHLRRHLVVVVDTAHSQSVYHKLGAEVWPETKFGKPEDWQRKTVNTMQQITDKRNFIICFIKTIHFTIMDIAPTYDTLFVIGKKGNIMQYLDLIDL